MATLTVSVILSALLGTNPSQGGWGRTRLTGPMRGTLPTQYHNQCRCHCALRFFCVPQESVQRGVMRRDLRNLFFAEKTAMPTVLFADTEQGNTSN